MFAVLCLRGSVVCSSWLQECSFSLTIYRQDLRDLIAVLICFAKVPFLPSPIWSVNAIPESLFWCSVSQNFSQYLLALHFVFVHIGNWPTSDLCAFELQTFFTPNSHLINFVCTESIRSFSPCSSNSACSPCFPCSPCSLVTLVRPILHVHPVYLFQFSLLVPRSPCSPFFPVPLLPCSPCYPSSPYSTCYPLFPLLPLVPPFYPSLPLFPLVSCYPCNPLLPLLPFLPLLPLVTPC